MDEYDPIGELSQALDDLITHDQVSAPSWTALARQPLLALLWQERDLLELLEQDHLYSYRVSADHSVTIASNPALRQGAWILSSDATLALACVAYARQRGPVYPSDQQLKALAERRSGGASGGIADHTPLFGAPRRGPFSAGGALPEESSEAAQRLSAFLLSARNTHATRAAQQMLAIEFQKGVCPTCKGEGFHHSGCVIARTIGRPTSVTDEEFQNPERLDPARLRRAPNPKSPGREIMILDRLSGKPLGTLSLSTGVSAAWIALLPTISSAPDRPDFTR